MFYLEEFQAEDAETECEFIKYTRNLLSIY